MTPTPKTDQQLTKIIKVTSFLNDLSTEINKNKGFLETAKKQEIHKKHSLSYDYFAVARDLNYFKKLEQNKYSSSFIIFEPIQARKLIIAQQQHKLVIGKRRAERMEAGLKSAELSPLTELTINHTPKIIKPAINKERGPAYEIVPETKPTRKKNRIFSFCWGFIKFSY